MSQRDEENVVFEKLKAGGFINIDIIASIISTAHYTQKNAILFGPPGFGKSEMSKLALEALGYSIDSPDPDKRLFIQSFGEGMTEDRLYGGLNFKKLRTEDTCEYNAGSGIGASFLDCGAAIFEEIFDAPAKVLLALKDTLTSGYLRNGPQMVKSRCKVIIANTNHNPEDIADMGPAAKALIERFALQHNVVWNNYEVAVYKNLLKAVSAVKPYKISDPILNILAELCAESASAGIVISPRAGVHGMDIIAKCNNGESLTPDDFAKLRLMPEFLAITDVSSKFKREIENIQFNNQIKGVRREFAQVHEKYNAILSAEKSNHKDIIAFIKDARVVANEIEKLVRKVNAIVATDQASAIKAEFEAEAKQCLNNLAAEVDRLMEKK